VSAQTDKGLIAPLLVQQEEAREGKKLILDHFNYKCHDIIQKDYDSSKE